MAFKHRISFATDLAANIGCNRFRSMPDIVSKLLRAAIWSCCAVPFESEQTPFPQTGCRFRPAALHRIRFGTCSFVPMSYFYSETNHHRHQWLIERFCEAMGTAFVGNNFSPISSKFWFHIKKKGDSLLPEIWKALKPCWLLNWVSTARVVAWFPQASRLLPAATAADSETLCVCACPSDPHKQSGKAAPRAWPLILPSKPSIIF